MLVFRIVSSGTIICIGFLLLMTSFTLVAPVPYIPLSPDLSLSVVCVMLQGAGAAAVIVSNYSRCLQLTISLDGYTNSTSTHSIVAGF